MDIQDSKRKPTAVFSVNVAGDSCIMGEDETAISKTLEARKQEMFCVIKQYP